MKFYDKNTGVMIWESATVDLPYEYYDDHDDGTGGGAFNLYEPKEFRYIKDFGDIEPLWAYSRQGELVTFTLQNDSTIDVDRRTTVAHAFSLLLYTPYMENYPLNGAFTMWEDNPTGGGYIPINNVFWQPDGKGAYVVGICERRLNSSGQVTSYYISFKKVDSWIPEYIQRHIDFFTTFDLSEDDTSTPTGGTGVYDTTSTNDIGFPPLPDVGYVDSHMLHAYSLTKAQSIDLANWVWTESQWERFKQLFGNPLDSVISFGLIPVLPSIDQSGAYRISMGFSQSDTARGYIVNSDWRIVDFGTFMLNETWGSFIDYSTTKIGVYLPYIGIKELSIDDCMSSELHLKYYINVITGDCTAFIKCTKVTDGKNIAPVNSVLYEFTGNLLVQIPLTGADFSSRMSSIISSAGAMIGATVATLASDGALAPVLASTAVSSGTSMLSNAKPSIMRNGNMSGITGYMGIQYPFVILTRPSQSLPDAFREIHGRMSMTTNALGTFMGYTRVYDCILDGINATDEEKTEIKSLLMSGVIV